MQSRDRARSPPRNRRGHARRFHPCVKCATRRSEHRISATMRSSYSSRSTRGGRSPAPSIPAVIPRSWTSFIDGSVPVATKACSLERTGRALSSRWTYPGTVILPPDEPTNGVCTIEPFLLRKSGSEFTSPPRSVTASTVAASSGFSGSSAESHPLRRAGWSFRPAATAGAGSAPRSEAEGRFWLARFPTRLIAERRYRAAADQRAEARARRWPRRRRSSVSLRPSR